MIVAALLLACGSEPSRTIPSGEAPPVEIRVGLDGEIRSGGGAVRVQVAYDPAGQVSLPEPKVDGLTFTADGPPTTERVGDRDVLTQRYIFSGAGGSYELPPLTAAWHGPEGAEQEATSPSLFVDVGVEPPREGELADIVEPDRIRRWPWMVFGAVGAVFAAGLLFAFRPRERRGPPPPPPVPPDRAALEAWERVRADDTIDVEQKATALAELFRVYVEAVLGFEATARTTREILDHLGSLTHLPEGNVQRAKRILRAVDLVRFAEDRPRTPEEWLADLDADLRAFVDATRPVSIQRPPVRR